MTWHLLQVSDVLDIEFGSALAERVPLIAWEPERVNFPTLRLNTDQHRIADPPLTIRRFPLLKGYSRLPWSALSFTGITVARQLLKFTDRPGHSPLICTIPYFAPVAERWPGPVVYWLTDRIEMYNGADAKAVHALDKRMCRAASLVCPNSSRLADYLMEHADCPQSKIRILPNATRTSNLLSSPAIEPGSVPLDLSDLPRPIAGVIGNLAGNMDWTFTEELVKLTPGLHWAFVGPTTMSIEDPKQNSARHRVMSLSQARFVGRKPYGELAAYAHAFDVAVLPYRLCEPTYSGSSTRFYEHLAAGRPMIATRGFEELLHKEPLLRLVDSAEEAAQILQQLAASDFKDGFERLRWEESRHGTWQSRAELLVDEMHQLLAPMYPVTPQPSTRYPLVPNDDRGGI